MATERLNRINQLAQKAKTEGLTAEETEERDRLRKEYLAAFRANVKAQLEAIVVVDENGNRIDPKQFRKKQ